MKTSVFSGKLQSYIEAAIKGSASDIDFIMSTLTTQSSLATTRFIDYALSLVESDEGIEQIRHYLFHGTLIQRNYASLFFNRLGEWKCVKEAYEQGLIDEIQAFAR